MRVSRASLCRLLIGIALSAALAACLPRASSGLPAPIATLPPADLTAAAAGRPTLPPTFTASPSWTPPPPAGSTALPSAFPTATATLSPSPPPSLTPTATRRATETPTWTPDTRLLQPTRAPASTGTPPTGIPGLATVTPNSSGPLAGTPIPSGCTASAAAPNLLQNPGFEGGFSRPQYDDVEVPQNWIVFWKPEGTPVTYDPQNTDGFRRPGSRLITAAPPYDSPLRVLAGNQALLIYGGNRVFDAGVLQQVAVTPGDTLCLAGSAHAWSQHQSDDRTRSRLVTEDDRANVTFQLGIDPSGGGDPFAGSVVWGAPANLYDSYQAIPGVQARAQGGTITVFVRGITRWRFDHNDLFFDEIRLVKLAP